MNMNTDLINILESAVSDQSRTITTECHELALTDLSYVGGGEAGIVG
jgi:hypothetical protein